MRTTDGTGKGQGQPLYRGLSCPVPSLSPHVPSMSPLCPLDVPRCPFAEGEGTGPVSLRVPSGAWQGPGRASGRGVGGAVCGGQRTQPSRPRPYPAAPALAVTASTILHALAGLGGGMVASTHRNTPQPCGRCAANTGPLAPRHRG